jgi:hypothetical protein
MKVVRRILKWSLLVILCLFVVAQFRRPAQTNPVIDASRTLEAHLRVDPATAAIFDRSCKDCHSNKTEWPWYSNVAPVSWFVIDHVDEGRGHVNFSEWSQYERGEQREILKDICKEVKSGGMPLSSYTPLHPGSKLTADDVKTICDWTNRQQATLGARE